MTQWFGESWGAPCCKEDEHVPTPVGASCARCKEPIRIGDQGMISPLIEMVGGIFTGRPIAHHLDCFLKGILPHGPECPHCRGVDIDKHAPDCGARGESGLCTCQPMPEGR